MSAEEAKRIVALAMESADDAPTYRQFLTGAEVAISAALAAARAEARNAAMEEAAKEVDKLQTMARGMVRRHKLYARDAETLKAAAHVVRALIGTDPATDREEG